MTYLAAMREDALVLSTDIILNALALHQLRGQEPPELCRQTMGWDQLVGVVYRVTDRQRSEHCGTGRRERCCAVIVWDSGSWNLARETDTAQGRMAPTMFVCPHSGWWQGRAPVDQCRRLCIRDKTLQPRYTIAKEGCPGVNGYHGQTTYSMVDIYAMVSFCAKLKLPECWYDVRLSLCT